LQFGEFFKKGTLTLLLLSERENVAIKIEGSSKQDQMPEVTPIGTSIAVGIKDCKRVSAKTFKQKTVAGN